MKAPNDGTMSSLNTLISSLSLALLLPVPLAVLNPKWGITKPFLALYLAFAAAWFWRHRKQAQNFFAYNEGESKHSPWFTFAIILVAYIASALTFYWSFKTNSFDFSIFDTMLYNTSAGDFMFTPFCNCNHFSIHITPIMMAIAPFHKVFASPYFLLLLQPIALWCAGLMLWRLMRHFQTPFGMKWIFLLGFYLNGWTISILNYGFHQEVFYPLAGFFLLDALLERKIAKIVMACIAFISIKEDASFYLFGLGLGWILFESQQKKIGLILLGIASVAAIVNFGWLLPFFRNSDKGVKELTYLAFWGHFGNTPGEIVLGMIKHPLQVIGSILLSQWYLLFGAGLMLSLFAPTALLAMFPAIFILGSSSASPMRSLGLYYSAPILPFFFWSLLIAYQRLGNTSWRHHRHRVLSLALCLLMLVKGTTLRYENFSWANLSSLKTVEMEMASVTTPICVQSALYPHIAYRPNILPLGPDCWNQSGSRLLLNTSFNMFPYSRDELQQLVGAQVLNDTNQLIRTPGR